MKKILLIIFTLISFNIKAEILNVNLSATKLNLSPGETTEVTVTVSSRTAIGAFKYESFYDENILKLEGSYPADAYLAEADNEKEVKIKFKFIAKKLGVSNFQFNIHEALSFKLDEYEEIKPASIKINVINKNKLDNNTNLKTLSVDGYNIDFNKDKLEYNITEDRFINKLIITANPESPKAKVNIKDYELKEGLNKIEILVEAEDGSSKTYIINFKIETPKEKIYIKYNNKDYEIDMTGNFNDYKYFIKKNIKINNKEVPALYHNKLNIYLINIIKDNKIKTIIYQDKKTKDFNYLEYNGLSLLIKENNLNNKEIYIGKKKIKVRYNKPYYYFEAINLENTKENIYRYDKITIQREFKTKDYTKLGLIILLIITYIGILALYIKGVNHGKKA